MATFIAGSVRDGVPAESGYLLAMIVSAVVLGLAALAGLRAAARPPQQQSPPPRRHSASPPPRPRPRAEPALPTGPAAGR